MESDVVVYNISESTTQEQIDEATWAFSGTLWHSLVIHLRTERKSLHCSVWQLLVLSSSTISPDGRDGQLEVEENVHFDFNPDDLGHDEAAGSGKLKRIWDQIAVWRKFNQRDCVFCAQDEIDLIFREEDFRRRRPHPRFKYHNELEKLVLKLSKIVSALILHSCNCTLVGKSSF